MSKSYRPLSPEEQRELEFYVKRYGRNWKLWLWRDWMCASAPPVLHALRNSHGPTWLHTYTLPRERRDA